MGTWGPGNLENDYANDALADWCADLLGTFFDRMRRSDSRASDEYDYTTLFVEFEIIFALDSHNLLIGSMPDPEEIDELKADFLRDWFAYRAENNWQSVEGFEEARSREIAASFDRLRVIAERWADLET